MDTISDFIHLHGMSLSTTGRFEWCISMCYNIISDFVITPPWDVSATGIHSERILDCLISWNAFLSNSYSQIKYTTWVLLVLQHVVFYVCSGRLEWYPASTKRRWILWTETWRPVRLISSTPIRETCFASWYDVVIVNWCLHGFWVILPVWRARHGTLENGTLWHSCVPHYSPLRWHGCRCCVARVSAILILTKLNRINSVPIG